MSSAFSRRATRGSGPANRQPDAEDGALGTSGEPVDQVVARARAGADGVVVGDRVQGDLVDGGHLHQADPRAHPRPDQEPRPVPPPERQVDLARTDLLQLGRSDQHARVLRRGSVTEGVDVGLPRRVHGWLPTGDPAGWRAPAAGSTG